MVVLPAATPVTRPDDEFTVAAEVLLLVQFPPATPVVVNCVVVLEQMVDPPLIVPAELVPTVIVNVCGVPVQLFIDGVTVIVAVIGLLVPFAAVKAPIFPLPLRPKPTFKLLLQL